MHNKNQKLITINRYLITVYNYNRIIFKLKIYLVVIFLKVFVANAFY